MKYFFIITVSMWSWFMLANQAFVGSWSWSAFQCRNSDFESSSARSVVWNIEDFNPASANITMESNGDASFTYATSNGNTREETGEWRTIDDENHVEIGDDRGGFRAWLIDGDLVTYGDKTGQTLNNGICESNEKFVLIFSKVD